MIVDALDLSLEWAESPQAFRRRHFRGWIPQEEWEALMRPTREAQAVKALRKKNWLRAREEGNRVAVELETDAVVAVIRERVRKTEKQLPKGSFCLVTFDFPVGADQARSSWRRFLKSAGFERRQLSVWISGKDVVKEIKILVNLLRLENRVAVFRCLE
jgi:DNA-binding transcriptional regulator PaaX